MSQRPVSPATGSPADTRQAECLAAVARGLTHDARNALQRYQACLEMLALEVQDRPKAAELVGRLQAAQDELAGAIRNALDAARAAAGNDAAFPERRPN